MQAVSVASVLFSSLLTELPYYLVWLAGIVLALVRWRRHPRVSLLAIVGLSLLFVDSLVGTALNAVLPFMVQRARMPYAVMGNLLGVVRIVLSLISATGFAVLLVAVFSGRGPQPTVEKQDQP